MATNTNNDPLNSEYLFFQNKKRYKVSYPVKISIKFDMKKIEFSGKCISINLFGLGCSIDSPIPSKNFSECIIEINAGSLKFNLSALLTWYSSEKLKCGFKFRKIPEAWRDFINNFTENGEMDPIRERRLKERREFLKISTLEQRKNERRFDYILSKLPAKIKRNKQKAIPPVLKLNDYSDESISSLRSWLETSESCSLSNIGNFVDSSQSLRGKIENPIGAVQIPVGVIGPLFVNGDHAKGQFFVPMATTEGALITSYSLGAHIIARSGGANVKINRDELKIGPIFVFKNLFEAEAFSKWLKINFLILKETAENTSKYLKLIKIETILDGRKVNANFHYSTSDAMGMNMACKATDAVCKKIVNTVKPEEFWLRSNFNANKKATFNGLISGYGKTVTAEVTIPRKVISLLNTTPEKMQRYVYRTLLSDSHAGMIGANGHFSNAITAIFIATGQDVASVANSHIGISTCEVTASGDMYFSVYLSSLLIGTVGGGTSLKTAAECLSLMDCLGENKAKKLAEIITVTALAGEISICAAIVNGTYVLAHELLGRNKPINNNA
ncbi:MAG: hydroxymethylglutaryl-CoA reductase [Elusimicrobiota bacterium]